MYNWEKDHKSWRLAFLQLMAEIAAPLIVRLFACSGVTCADANLPSETSDILVGTVYCTHMLVVNATLIIRNYSLAVYPSLEKAIYRPLPLDKQE